LKVLIIGSGGREHAIADSFARCNEISQITVAPGNPGIALEHRCVPLLGPADILRFCRLEHPSLVFIGPEQPLAEGLSDLLRDNGFNCIGPSQAAARIETSKIFAKQLMSKYQIPTADFHQFQAKQDAIGFIHGNDHYPIVIKADGLAAGKGVIIAGDRNEALAGIELLMQDSHATKRVVIEEYLKGWEVSLFAVTDGFDYRCTLFSQDHKQLYDQDKGPNTGGMGAWCPVREAEPFRHSIENDIIEPVLHALKQEGSQFSGFLYCGLMITAEGPKVLEFNCRLGDPEAQAMLPLLKTPITEVCHAISTREVNKLNLQWFDQYSICVVLASKGYPGSYDRGLSIEFEQNPASKVFYSGVNQVDGKLVTNGGRVMSLVALGSSLEEAREAVYRDVQAVHFHGKTFRNDISLRNNII